MTPRYLGSFSLALIAFIPACVIPAVEFEGQYWFPDFDLEAKVVDDNIGTDTDFKKELGMKDENFPGGRFKWFTGENSWIRLDYTSLDYSGDKVVEVEDIEFAGEIFPVGTRVLSDLEMEHLRFGWGWQFIDVGEGTFKCGTLLELQGFYLDASLEAPDVTPVIEESDSLPIAFPTVGFVLDVNPVKAIDIFGEATGITAGSYGYFYQADVGLKFIPFENFTLSAGYRIFKFDVEIDSDTATMQLNGPYIGGSLRF